MKEELDRVAVVEEIMNKVAGFVQKSSYIFPFFSKYLKESHQETEKFLKVTIYCFIGECYNFSINEYYC